MQIGVCHIAEGTKIRRKPSKEFKRNWKWGPIGPRSATAYEYGVWVSRRVAVPVGVRDLRAGGRHLTSTDATVQRAGTLVLGGNKRGNHNRAFPVVSPPAAESCG